VRDAVLRDEREGVRKVLVALARKPQITSVANCTPGTSAVSVSMTCSNCVTLYSRFIARSTASLPL